MKITYEKLFQLDAVAGAYIKKDEAETKLKYAIEKKLAKQITEHHKSYNEAIGDINIDHCYADEKNVIIKDEKGEFKFTKEALKKRNEAAKDLLNTEIEIVPYIVKEHGELTDLEKEYFSGILIEEIKE